MIKNTFYIFCGRIANALFLFLLTLTVSRLLGPALFGTYSFLTTVILTGTYLANYGLDTLMVRGIAKDHNRAKTYLSNILGLKIFTSLVTILLIASIFQLSSLDSRTKHLLLVLSISLLFNSLSQTLWYYGDGFEKFLYHSLLWTLSNFAKSAIGIVLVFTFYDIYPLISGLVFAEALSFVFAYYFIKKRFGSYSLSFDFSIWYDLIIKSTPLAIGAIFSALYFRLDIVMLKMMREAEIVGWYSAAYKLIEVFTIFPSAIVMVFFPSLVKSHHKNVFEFKKIIFSALTVLFSAGIILAISLSALSENIIMIIFGKLFLPSVIVLQILSWALFLIFINYLLSHVLISVGKEGYYASALIIITLLNFGLNLLLIPKYGHVGAGWATLISEIILMVLYGFAIKKTMSLQSAASGHNQS